MITIQSGKMIIPENERFVGFAGDNLTCTKEFLVPDAADSDSDYILYLRFDDDRVSSAVLEKSVDGGDLVLVWNVRSEHLLKSGVILAQIKITDGDVIIAHTGCDYFIAARSNELDDDGGELDILRRTEFERRMAEAVADARATAPYIGDDGYWYVYSPEERDYVRSWHATGAVDSEISSTSTNPVQNKVVKAYVDGVAASFPSALSAFANDVGYIPTYAAASAPPSSQTSAYYPAPCVWMYDDRFWLVYSRSAITVPGSPTQYNYGFMELVDSGALPTKTSDLINDSGFLTAHQNISGKMDKTYAANDAESIAEVPTGQLFTAQGRLAHKTALGYEQIANLTDIPTVPTNVSSFTNDAGYLTAQNISGKMDKTYAANDSESIAAVPTGQLFTAQGRLAHKTALGYEQIANLTDIPTVPTNVSSFTNDAGYLTAQNISGKMDKTYAANDAESIAAVPTGQLFTAQGRLAHKTALGYEQIANLTDIPTVPTNVSSFTNDAGYLTAQNISGKMDKTYAANDAESIAAVPVGQLFTAQGRFCRKLSASTYDEIASLSDINGKEDASNKVTSLSSSSTDTQYPSAKCVYDLIGDIESLLQEV